MLGRMWGGRLRSGIGAGCIALAVTLVLACFAAQAHAQAPADAGRAAARAKVQEGAALFDAGNFAGALARFDEAYARFPAPAIHFNRAQALRALGRNAEAEQALERFIKEAKDASAEKRAEAEQQLAELRRAHAPAPVAPAPVVPAPVARPPVAPAPAPAPPVVTIAAAGAPPAASLSHERQLGLALRTDIGVTAGGGAVVIPELTYGVGQVLEIGAGALIGYYKGGLVEGRLFLLDGRWKPLLTVSIPVFDVDGIRPGVQPGAGVAVEIGPHLGVAAAATAVYFPSPPSGLAKLWFVPSVGIQGRL